MEVVAVRTEDSDEAFSHFTEALLDAGLMDVIPELKKAEPDDVAGSDYSVEEIMIIGISEDSCGDDEDVLMDIRDDLESQYGVLLPAYYD